MLGHLLVGAQNAHTCTNAMHQEYNSNISIVLTLGTSRVKNINSKLSRKETEVTIFQPSFEYFAHIFGTHFAVYRIYK